MFKWNFVFCFGCDLPACLSCQYRPERTIIVATVRFGLFRYATWCYKLIFIYFSLYSCRPVEVSIFASMGIQWPGRGHPQLHSPTFCHVSWLGKGKGKGYTAISVMTWALTLSLQLHSFIGYHREMPSERNLGYKGLQGWPTARDSGWWQLAGEKKSTSVENLN